MGVGPSTLGFRITFSEPKPMRRGTICRAEKSEMEGSGRWTVTDDGWIPKSLSMAALFKGANWLKDAPQIRVRSAEQRSQDQLAELAVLNERLAGETEPWQIRRKVEYLKLRRQNWERIYNHITKQDAIATLRSIEEANKKVEEALSEESRETQSVENLRKQLVELQEEVNKARQKLHVTEVRVEQNVARVKELRQEAEQLERLKQRKDITNGTPEKLEVTRPSQYVDGQAVQTTKQGRRGLHSSLDMEDGLQNFWYPVQFSSKLGADTLTPFDLLEKPWVLFRDQNGRPACVLDECAHRACPLSLGKVVDGEVQCPYHGWQYNRRGECTRQPSTLGCKNVAISSLPVAERDGLIWVWPGYLEPTEVPDYTLPPEGYSVHAEIEMTVPVEHGLLLENLLDLAHAPFTHTTTFAKGWPVPDFVKFRTARMLGGNWEPYPIDMSFEPPCMVLSTIGLTQPGKIERGQRAASCENHLHQLHICLPSKKGEARLLYRMGLDFLQWARFLPFMDKVWTGVANQVLGEDLVLVKGQQQRLVEGADTWANPVSYDKLAVQYRRWRNSVGSGGSESNLSGRVKMSAGEIFRDEELESES